MSVELKIPEVGESITEVQIGEWLKSPGDAVKQDEVVATIETDKVTVEVSAPRAGTLGEILLQEGQDAKVGDVIGYVEEGDGGEAGPAAESEDAGAPKTEKKKSAQAAKAAPQKKAAEKKSKSRTAKGKAEEQPASSPAPAQDESPKQAEPRVMPAAQRALNEAGVDARQVEGTGPGGRIQKQDAVNYVRRQAARPDGTPSEMRIDFDREEQVFNMSPMRRRIAENLVRAQQDMALLTTFNEADMSAVLELRKQQQEAFQNRYGIKLGFMSFFVKAVVDALQMYPAINAEIRDRQMVYRNYYDIGVAIGGGKGLVVPVLRNAEAMSFAEIEQQVADFAARAKDGKLQLEELQGGTFTITNGGVFGSLLSTPIVNPPQSGVLGMHAIQKRPVVVNDEVVVRPMMYLALTYDHRIVDGREAVQCLVRIKETIEQPARLLLEA